MCLGVRWLGGDHLGEEFLEAIQEDEVVDEILVQINNVVQGEYLTKADNYHRSASTTGIFFLNLSLVQ